MSEMTVAGGAPRDRAGTTSAPIADRLPHYISDAPFDPEKGPMNIRETIKVIESLDLTETERAMVFHGNAERLLKLASHAAAKAA